MSCLPAFPKMDTASVKPLVLLLCFWLRYIAVAEDENDMPGPWQLLWGIQHLESHSNPEIPRVTKKILATYSHSMVLWCHSGRPWQTRGRSMEMVHTRSHEYKRRPFLPWSHAPGRWSMHPMTGEQAEQTISFWISWSWFWSANNKM